MTGRSVRLSAVHPSFLCLLFWFLVCLLVGAATAATAAPGVELPVRIAAPGLVAAPVRITGAEGSVTAWMLVDTGATRSRIDARLAAKAGMRARARYELEGLDGAARSVSCGGPVELGLGDHAVEVECLAWSESLEVSLGLDGVLGADALAQLDVLFDAAAGRLRVAPAGTLRSFVAGTPLEARALDGRPAVAARWSGTGGGISGFVVLDSGADVAVLFGAESSGLGSDPARGSLARVDTNGGTITAPVTRVLSLQLGSLRLATQRTVLLPPAPRREELGLVPVSALGPTLFALADGVVVAQARLRRKP